MLPSFTVRVSAGVSVSGNRSPREPPLVVVKPLNPQWGGTPPTSNSVVVKPAETNWGTEVLPIGSPLLLQGQGAV